MSHARSLKPSFFRSRSLAKVPPSARLTFQGLWCEADDAGIGIADHRLLKGAVWPLDDNIGHDDVADHLETLAETGHIVLYEVAGERYYKVNKWFDHQAPSFRRGASKYPEPPDPVDIPSSATERGVLPPLTSTNDSLHNLAQRDVQKSAGVEGRGVVSSNSSSSLPCSSVEASNTDDDDDDDDEEPWWDQWAKLDLARQRRDGHQVHNPPGWLKQAAANRKTEFGARASALIGLTQTAILTQLRRSAGELSNQPAPLERCPTCDRLTFDCTCHQEPPT